jgi:hypothetical protein
MAKALRVIDQRLGALIDAWSVADVGVCGAPAASVNGKTRSQQGDPSKVISHVILLPDEEISANRELNLPVS